MGEEVKVLDRKAVRMIHDVANKAVAKAVEGLGYTMEPCTVSYSSYDGTINYKVKLIVKGMEEKAKNLNAVRNWKVGDIAKDRRGQTWKIVGFTTRGSIKIESDFGKTYRCKADYLLPKEA